MRSMLRGGSPTLRRSGLCLTLLLTSASAPRATDETLVLTPEAAVDLAVAAHPTVLRARERLVELEEQIQEARSGALPKIEADVSVSRSRDPALLNSPQFSELGSSDSDPDGTSDPILDAIRDLFRFDPSPETLTSYYYGVHVEQTLYAFGKIRTGIRAAEVLRERFRLEVVEAEAEAARQAVVALYGLALAERQIEVLAAERASRERQVQQARDFLEIGTGTRLDLLQAQAALSGLRPREIAAEGAIERARVTLNETLSRSPLAPVRAAPNVLEGASLPDDPQVATILGLGAAKPELRALAVESEAYSLQERATRAELLPEITFMGNYGLRTIFTDELFNGDFTAWDAGIYFTWNLFDGYETRSLARQIASRRRQSELTHMTREGEIARDIIAAALEYGRAREAVTASAVAVEQAEEALRVAEEESRWGAATPLDVLEGQRTLTDARYSRLQSIHDALVALAEVYRLAGKKPGEPLEVSP